jgi:hypothetical protein
MDDRKRMLCTPGPRPVLAEQTVFSVREARETIPLFRHT